MEDIHLTVTHGIRNTTDADARYSEMPKPSARRDPDATQIDAGRAACAGNLGAGA
jgi:cytochrome c oxidase cbb3-type subunit III